MNKKFFLFIALSLLLLVGTVSATIDWDTEAEAVILLYEYSTGVTGLVDLTGNSNDATAYGGASFNVGKTAFDFDGDGDYLDISSVAVADTSDYTVSMWVNQETYASADQWLFDTQSGRTAFAFNKATYTGNAGVYDGASWNDLGYTLSTSTDYHLVYVVDKSANTIKVYVNGDLENTISSVPDKAIGGTTHIAQQNTGASEFNGLISDFIILNKAITMTEVGEIYAEGKNYNPYDVATSKFKVTAVDYVDDSSISSFWAYIDGTNYTTTNGTIYTSLFQNNTNTFTLQVGATDYFSETYSSLAVTSDKEASLHQSEISFIAKELISGDTLSGVTYVIDGVTNTTFYLNAGVHTVTASKSGYYDKNLTFNVTAKQIETLNVTGMYDSLIEFNLNDIVTTDLIASTSYVSIDDGSGYVANYSNSNGSIEHIGLLQGNYSVTLWADDYAYLYENITVNSTSQSFNYTLYSYNSVWVTAVNSLTGDDLTNFTVNIYNDNKTYQLTDLNTGTAKFSNITSGVYTVLVAKDGFDSASYPLTVTGGSYQNLVGYLIAEGLSTIFTVTDIVSGSIIESAQVSMYKTIGASWVLVASEDTDITGRVQLSYLPDIEYKFVVDKTGYVQRTFFLEVLFDTYTIRLTPDVESVPDVNVGDWVYEISNNGYFYDDSVNNFSISLSSGTGTIEYYNLTVINYNGSSTQVDCSNSYGCTDDFSFNITGATWDQTINVSYTIKESGYSEKTFSKFYIIQNIAADDTMFDWSEAGGDGFGSLEKALAATILMLIIVGSVAVASLSLGVPAVTVSGIALAVTAGIMAAVDFIPNYAAWLIGLGVLLIVIFGRGEI